MLRMYQGSDDYQERVASIKEFINFHHLPKNLATRLQESFQHAWQYTNGVDMGNVGRPPLPLPLHTHTHTHTDKDSIDNMPRNINLSDIFYELSCANVIIVLVSERNIITESRRY